MTVDQLCQIAGAGESETVELKKSTAQLRRACETLCGMLNGSGGKVLIGVTPGGKVVGQEVSDKTLREVADMEALREALVNGICHRDYGTAGGAVSLAIFDDRLEIWSDGTLPFGLKPEDLKRDHPSRPRNPLIAKVFYLRGVIERWGRGTQRIVELCVKAGHPEPEFGEQAGAVWVRFLPRSYIAPHRVMHDLTERQREVLQILSTASPIPFRQIRANLETPPADRTLQDDLAHLKRLGLIESKGRGRGAVWFLTKQME